MITPHLDFIEVYEGLVDPAVCAAICRRFDSSAHGEGLVGSGLYPNLKESRDLVITGLVEWNDMAALLMQAVLKPLLLYLRKYRHAGGTTDPGTLSRRWRFLTTAGRSGTGRPRR